MTTLHDLPTPCAVVDLDRVEANCARMKQRAAHLGVTLRPHVKTHKTVQGARLQTDGSAVTVSTLAEARFFADAGFDDITWAVPLPLSQLDAALQLAERVRLNLLVDHPAAVDALVASGRRPRVFVKVDCGYHRAGIDPQDPASVGFVDRVRESLELAGLLTHAGHSYDCVGREQIEAVARTERDVIVDFAAKCGEVDVVSVGSTPTMSVAKDLTGVTEIRPGNYIFFDRFQAAIGSCTEDDIALTVLASVIGSYDKRAILDAGALAMSKDAGAVHAGNADYGVVCDLHGTERARLKGLSQEHGKVDVSLPFGERVRILPNHSCLVAALHPVLYVVRGNEVVDEWHPARGW